MLSIVGDMCKVFEGFPAVLWRREGASVCPAICRGKVASLCCDGGYESAKREAPKGEWRHDSTLR